MAIAAECKEEHDSRVIVRKIKNRTTASDRAGEVDTRHFILPWSSQPVSNKDAISS
jgi:hypothetical protein